ncbi:MAG TPA: hypothetical protein PKZ84_18325 [Anaerolineae bacterium]|nr:hypothetical protein [Anaerolineae bacterium]HQI85633.1 hypothetical protein [Anaerolineae bacterium]
MTEKSIIITGAKLILIEGIPGSGKTSAARFVCDWLTQHGQRPRLFLEGDWQHPADFESVACLDDAEYAGLRAQFPAQADFLAQHARQENGEWFFSYRQMQHEHSEQPDALFESLARFEIYNLPAEKHQRLMRQNWRKFTAEALAQDVVYVFECCFLQNPITTLLAYHNLPVKAVRQHVLALADIVSPLTPKLVYLARQDVAATLAAVRRERPPEWADFVTWYLTGQDYGKAHNLSGFDGVSAFYAMRQALELELLKTLPLASAVIADDGDWDTRYEILASFLEQT